MAEAKYADYCKGHLISRFFRGDPIIVVEGINPDDYRKNVITHEDDKKVDDYCNYLFTLGILSVIFIFCTLWYAVFVNSAPMITKAAPTVINLINSIQTIVRNIQTGWIIENSQNAWIIKNILVGCGGIFLLISLFGIFSKFKITDQWGYFERFLKLGGQKFAGGFTVFVYFVYIAAISIVVFLTGGSTQSFFGMWILFNSTFGYSWAARDTRFIKFLIIIIPLLLYGFTLFVYIDPGKYQLACASLSYLQGIFIIMGIFVVIASNWIIRRTIKEHEDDSVSS